MPKTLKDYKDVEKAKAYRKRHRTKNYQKTAFKYGRRRWTDEEIELVLRQEVTDLALSAQIKRSVQAIQLKRMKEKRGESMRELKWELTEEEYRRYSGAERSKFAEEKVPDYIFMGYGYYGVRFRQEGDKYYALVSVGSTCD